MQPMRKHHTTNSSQSNDLEKYMANFETVATKDQATGCKPTTPGEISILATKDQATSCNKPTTPGEISIIKSSKNPDYDY